MKINNQRIGNSGVPGEVNKMNTECIGCGCTDIKGCKPNPEPCSWLLKDNYLSLGVCSNCEAHVEALQNQQNKMSEMAKEIERDFGAIYSVHCSKCEFNQNELTDDLVPESCPKCGEYKEFTILENSAVN